MKALLNEVMIIRFSQLSKLIKKLIADSETVVLGRRVLTQSTLTQKPPSGSPTCPKGYIRRCIL
jgi:hypothetical protein